MRTLLRTCCVTGTPCTGHPAKLDCNCERHCCPGHLSTHNRWCPDWQALTREDFWMDDADALR